MQGGQAGISLFQKDNNYFTFTVEKNREKHLLKLLLKEWKKDPVVIHQTFIKSYNGSITFKVISENNSYNFYYSLDNGTSFNLFIKTGFDKILSKGYTGAYMGLYTTTSVRDLKEFADFDWVTVD